MNFAIPCIIRHLSCAEPYYLRTTGCLNKVNCNDCFAQVSLASQISFGITTLNPCPASFEAQNKIRKAIVINITYFCTRSDRFRAIWPESNRSDLCLGCVKVLRTENSNLNSTSGSWVDFVLVVARLDVDVDQPRGRLKSLVGKRWDNRSGIVEVQYHRRTGIGKTAVAGKLKTDEGAHIECVTGISRYLKRGVGRSSSDRSVKTSGGSSENPWRGNISICVLGSNSERRMHCNTPLES